VKIPSLRSLASSGSQDYDFASADGSGDCPDLFPAEKHLSIIKRLQLIFVIETS
jgi:hypothetical protein